jgi:protein phosphatase
LHKTASREAWLAAGRDEATYELQVQPKAEALRPPPAACAGAVRLPIAEKEDGAKLLRLYPVIEGRPLSEVLGPRVSVVTALATVETVGKALSVLAEAGCAAVGLYPDLVMLGRERATLLWEGPYPALADPPRETAPTPGYSPPEAFGRGEGQLSPASDVFVLGMLLYRLLSGAPLIPEVAESGVELPRLRAWRPDLPPGFEGLVRRATHRLASRRIPTVAAFLAELALCQERLARRTNAPYAALRHEVATEQHIGLAKGRERAVNEDALLSRLDAGGVHALLAVADGVSHATLGTGDIASKILVAAADERWERLAGGRLFAAEIAPHVAENLLTSIVRAANESIIEQANALRKAPTDLLGEVMATTAVLALVDGNRVHLANLGDSRAYLFSGGELEEITADHDVRHELWREHRPFGEVMAAAGGSQLTRFVGRLMVRDDAFAAVDPDADFFHLTLLPGDRVLLCSDGISDYVGATEAESDEAIARVLREHRDPARAAYELTVLANRAGGGDNISCVVLDVFDERSLEAPWRKN